VTGTSSGFEPVYAIVGKVSEGMDVVQKIGKLGDASSPTGAPTKQVVIDKATLEQG
jgi:cyclophilin family peptidyl-prolyl cis-trans isomerase